MRQRRGKLQRNPGGVVDIADHHPTTNPVVIIVVVVVIGTIVDAVAADVVIVPVIVELNRLVAVGEGDSLMSFDASISISALGGEDGGGAERAAGEERLARRRGRRVEKMRDGRSGGSAR